MTVALSRFLGPVPLDVVIRESHEAELEITSNPVEFGADVSDHAFVRPKKMMLEAVTASRPGGTAGLIGAYQAIVRLQETREPFSIVTGLMLYKNMLIERVTVDRDKVHGRILYFRADLKEVIIVDTQTTTGGGSEGQSKLSKGKLQSGATSDRGSPTVQRGNNATAPAPTSGGSVEAVKNQSILRGLY